MADIAGYNQGQVSDEGQVNWRGDQVSVTPGNQSVYDTSAVKLADLGSRKVVGDRVFRYAQAGGTINAGDLVQVGPVGVAQQIINVTAGTVNNSGGKIFSFYFATSYAANVFADGYLISQSGTAANMGQIYKVKSHASVSDTAKANLVLYDPLKRAANVTDKWSLFQNPYKYVTQNTAGTASPVGVAGVACTTGDFVWLQTYGPCCVKAGIGAAEGVAVGAGATGQVAGLTVVTNAVPDPVGFAMQTLTVSERGMVWLTIAP